MGRLKLIIRPGPVRSGALLLPGESKVPSLRPALDRERTEPSYSMEDALLRIAEALAARGRN